AGIDEANAVQAGEGVGADALPLEAAVAREQEHADAAGSVRPLLATGDPAGEGVDEVQGAQRRPHPGRLPLPVPAAVDGVPDDALVTDGPALVAVHELDGAQGRVLEMTQVVGARARGERGPGKECHQNGSHDWPSVPSSGEAATRARAGLGRGLK